MEKRDLEVSVLSNPEPLAFRALIPCLTTIESRKLKLLTVELTMYINRFQREGNEVDAEL